MQQLEYAFEAIQDVLVGDGGLHIILLGGCVHEEHMLGAEYLGVVEGLRMHLLGTQLYILL